MSLLNTLLGNSNPEVHDKDIAFDTLKDSKYNICCLAKAAMETVTPELRQLLSTQLTDALNLHFELSDILIKNQWYPAKDDPNQQLQKDFLESPIKFKKDNWQLKMDNGQLKKIFCKTENLKQKILL